MTLSDFKEIKYFVSNAKDGNLDFRFDNKQAVLNNRKKYFQKIKVDMQSTVCMNVINHEDDILIVKEENLGKGIFDLGNAPKVDALITNKPNICLMLLTADCLPASLYDPFKKVVTLVHLSKKTTSRNLAKKVINLLAENFGANPKGIVSQFGPYIHKESYMIDLAAENIKQFTDLGVLKENITISSINTYTSLDYFSYRKSQDQKIKEGRFTTILGMDF